MPSAPYLLAIVAAVVLVVVVVLVLTVVVGRRPGPDRPADSTDPTPAPPPEAAPAPPAASPTDDLFHPVRPAGERPALTGMPQWRPNGRYWPGTGMRELAAAAAGQTQPSLRGTIRGNDGAPLGGAVLTVINVTGGQAGMARTEADGRYRLDIPEEGSYVVIVRGAHHEPHASTVEVHRPYTVCDLRLTSAGGLSGTVTDEAGAPVRGATVILTSTAGAVVAARRSNERGAYVVTDVPPGQYTLTVTATGFDPTAVTIELPRTGLARYDPVLGTQFGVLRGTAIHEADGRPLADIRVRLVDADGRHVATVHTGPDGRYEFGRLGGGRYLVVASGYPEVASEVDLDGDHEHQVRLGWSEPVSMRVGAEEESQ